MTHHAAAEHPIELVVLAAGAGRRFGGLKQLEPVGPGGEPLMDYAVFDAARAGVRRVVFVIRTPLEREFHAAAGRRYGGRLEVAYAFQEDGGRGTGHALLAARAEVRGPFITVNADDFYGAEGLQLLAEFLRVPAPAGVETAAVAAFRLKNTFSDSGPVSRAVCRVATGGRLAAVVEHPRIDRRTRPFTGHERVSMNLWAFHPGIFPLLAERFDAFAASGGADPVGEFQLPTAISELVAAGRLDVRVLDTSARWMGMTYRDDVPAVAARLAEMAARGEYPARLWE